MPLIARGQEMEMVFECCYGFRLLLCSRPYLISQSVCQVNAAAAAIHAT